MTGKKGLKGKKHFKSDDAKCARGCEGISVFVYAGVSLLCSIEMPAISSSLYLCVCAAALHCADVIHEIQAELSLR